MTKRLKRNLSLYHDAPANPSQSKQFIILPHVITERFKFDYGLHLEGVSKGAIDHQFNTSAIHTSEKRY